MKKYYDKVLFSLGLVVLAIGVGFFYLKGGTTQSSTPLPAMKLTGSGYRPVSPPEFVDKSADWEAPPDQGEEDRLEPGWTYSIFTPPRIWWVTGIGWSAIQPNGVVTRPPFGVELVKASKDLYRIQINGIAGKGDPTDLITFIDEESGYTFQLRVGDENAHAQVKVTDMTVDRVQTEHGIVKEEAKVTILDERTNQTVTLTQGEPYSPTNSEYYLLHISKPYPDQDWRVTSVGDKFELPNKAFFVVTALDFDKPSVTVEKHIFNRSGREIKNTRVLTPVPQTGSAPEPAAAPSTPPAGQPAAKPAADPFAP